MRLANMLGFLCVALAISFAGMVRAQQVARPAMKIVAFGTSLTARANWPEKLGAALQACTGKAITVDKVAKSGETTRWGLTQLDRVVALQPDVVLIELYANDAAMNRLIGVGESRANYAAILDRLRASLPKARIYSMSMNPMLGLKRMLRPSLSGYIAAHRQETEARGLGYIDNLPNWERLDGTELARIIPDGSHPLPDEASKIIVPELVRVLSGGECSR